jgi:hypothetical protein
MRAHADADANANQDDYPVPKQPQMAQGNHVDDDEIKRWIELFKNAGLKSGQTRCLRCGHTVDSVHR